MSLSQSLLKQLWDAGYGGKVIRVPVRNERLQLKVIANQILKDAEDIYESKGTTFVLERRGRSDFYRSFGALKLCRRFHLSVDEARKVRRRPMGGGATGLGSLKKVFLNLPNESVQRTKADGIIWRFASGCGRGKTSAARAVT